MAKAKGMISALIISALIIGVVFAAPSYVTKEKVGTARTQASLSNSRWGAEIKFGHLPVCMSSRCCKSNSDCPTILGKKMVCSRHAVPYSGCMPTQNGMGGCCTFVSR